MTKLANYDKYHYDYRQFWKKRQYEDGAERVALRKLLKDSHFKNFVDIGGSYGRLTNEYYDNCDNVYIIDYSLETLVRNREQLVAQFPHITLIAANAYHMPFTTNSLDGGLMVRVMHHIDSQEKFLKEANRVFNNKSKFILEYANKLNIKNVLRMALENRETAFDVKPYQQPSRGNNEGTKGEKVVFLNYHPRYMSEKVVSAGFFISTQLSVSFFRSTPLSKLPVGLVLFLERLLQRTLSWTKLTPAIFLELQKSNSSDTKNTAKDRPGAGHTSSGPHSDDHLSIVCCPACHGTFSVSSTGVQCNDCQRVYKKTSGVLDLRYNDDT